MVVAVVGRHAAVVDPVGRPESLRAPVFESAAKMAVMREVGEKRRAGGHSN